jgi:pimeloyl-ACP methyl ester carboxylesterase
LVLSVSWIIRQKSFGKLPAQHEGVLSSIIHSVRFAPNMQRLIFTIAVTLISRALILRDRLLGRLRRIPAAAGVQILRHALPIGTHSLDSVLVAPAESPRAALLICHGIGEITDHWLAAQQLLAANGIASLVFDYSGFGKSGGVVDWEQCEDDAISAFAFLQTLVANCPVSILGFSMGSGIAGAILRRIAPAHLILASAFTSFREAACVLGLPRAFAGVLPPIWCGGETLPGCTVPVLIVHCERDRAFPVRMARELASFCGANGELVLVPNQAYNKAFYDPKLTYWRHVIGRLIPHKFCRS